MKPKPVARPRRETTPAIPLLKIPTVAVKIAFNDDIFYHCATDGARSWCGFSSAPTREAALLDVFAEVRSSVDGPIRFVVSVPPPTHLWRHIDELQKALYCVVDRARLDDQPLMDAAGDQLTVLLPRPASAPPVQQSADEPTELIVGEPLIVATDGSVRGRFAGYGWLADDGRFRLQGSNKPRGLHRLTARKPRP